MTSKTDTFSDDVLSLYHSSRSVKEESPLRSKIALINSQNFDKIGKEFLLELIADQGEHFADFDPAYREMIINRKWNQKANQHRRELNKQAKDYISHFFDREATKTCRFALKRLLIDLILIDAGKQKNSLRQWLFCDKHIGYSEFYMEEVQLREQYLRQKARGDDRLEVGHIDPSIPMCEDASQLDACVHSFYRSSKTAEIWMLHLPSVQRSIQTLWDQYFDPGTVEAKKTAIIKNNVKKILSNDFCTDCLIRRLMNEMDRCETQEKTEDDSETDLFPSYETRLNALKEAEKRFYESRDQLRKYRPTIGKQADQKAVCYNRTKSQISDIFLAVLHYFDVPKERVRENVLESNIGNLIFDIDEKRIPFALLKSMDSYRGNFYRNDFSDGSSPQHKSKDRNRTPQKRMKQIRFVDELRNAESLAKIDDSVYLSYLAQYGYEIRSAEEYRFWCDKQNAGIDLPIISSQIAFLNLVWETMQTCISTRDGVSLVGTFLVETDGEASNSNDARFLTLQESDTFSDQFWDFVQQHDSKIKALSEMVDSEDAFVRTYIQWWKYQKKDLIKILKKELERHKIEWNARLYRNQTFLSIIWKRWIDAGGELSKELPLLQKECADFCLKEGKPAPLWLRRCKEALVEYIIRETERTRAMEKLVAAFDSKYECSLSGFLKTAGKRVD